MPYLLADKKVGGIELEGPQPRFQRLSPSPKLEQAHAIMESSRRFDRRPLECALDGLSGGTAQDLLDRLNRLGLADIEPTETPKSDDAVRVDDPSIRNCSETVE